MKLFSRVFKNKTTVGIVCIIVAFIICFGLTPLFNSAVKAKTTIARISKDVTKGEMISSSDVENVEVGKYNLPDGVIKNKNKLIGKYAAVDLTAGDYVLPEKVSNTPVSLSKYLYKLPKGKEAISVTIKSFADGLSGKLQSGDIVSFIITSDSSNEDNNSGNATNTNQTTVPEQLKYVKVLAVTTSKGTDGASDKRVKTQNADGSSDNALPATVTVQASKDQAILLANAEETGKIHIALKYRGSKKKANKLLKNQDKLLKDNIDNTDLVQ
jgi:pilus assembly protein CpaB